MKKSEFIDRFRPASLDPLAIAIWLAAGREAVTAAEAAGVVWDPEGGPVRGESPAPAPKPVELPERLALWPDSDGYLVPEGSPWESHDQRLAGSTEAVRRYNEWERVTANWRRDWESATARAEKAEAEVQRLSGVIDEYCKALQENGAELHRVEERYGRLREQDRVKIENLKRSLEKQLDITAEAVGRRRGHERQIADLTARAAAADEALSIALKQNRLLTAERDALKLAVQEGEAEVGRLREALKQAETMTYSPSGLVTVSWARWLSVQGLRDQLRDDLALANQENVRLRRRVALIQGFFSDDKDQFRESLRAILQEREQEDGDEK